MPHKPAVPPAPQPEGGDGKVGPGGGKLLHIGAALLLQPGAVLGGDRLRCHAGGGGLLRPCRRSALLLGPTGV